MSYAQSRDALESTASYATIWREIEWNKVKRYVNKQRHRIFRAENDGNKRKVRDLQKVNRNILRNVSFQPVNFRINVYLSRMW